MSRLRDAPLQYRKKSPFLADVKPFFLVHHEDSNINKNQGNKTDKKSQSWCFTPLFFISILFQIEEINV